MSNQPVGHRSNPVGDRVWSPVCVRALFYLLTFDGSSRLPGPSSGVPCCFSQHIHTPSLPDFVLANAALFLFSARSRQDLRPQTNAARGHGAAPFAMLGSTAATQNPDPTAFSSTAL
ncbi:hypothetical protein MAPG_06116 [Magnaporthiopsis poae ATCC 64411]|uniref:Uncharacterized protein n=1 Tax=Magnaporthiopsis poae (strain ATCC 64411 / 73-15) TaxID=644358 RepID=A0A0C4E167_MAGP6|nr:hypothetical protein MAPG_06116 [Magnaporthiopsis poae ATCC 64411]